MQAAQSSVLRRVASLSGVALTMSAIARRPPGRSTRAASAKTRCLTGERLTTPFEITTSKLASSNGRRSMLASTKRTLLDSAALAEPDRVRDLRVGEVDADDASRRADTRAGAERVGAGARAEIEHAVAGPQLGEVEVVADARERRE